MAFEVILCHYWVCGEVSEVPVYLRLFAELRLLAVPAFMIMSFYFLTNSVLTRDICIFKRRFARLLVPYLGWGIVYYFCYSIADMIFKTEFVNGISDLGWQLLFGSSRNLDPPLWFQADLIILTFVVFAVFYFIPSDKAFMILFGLTIVSLYMQYSGINYSLFGGWEYESRYTCGRICEMMPYAYAGMVLSYSRIDKKILEGKKFWMIADACLLILLLRFPIFCEIEMQFAYAGAGFVCTAVLIVLLVLPVSCCKLPLKVRRLIKWFARYTLGVFCIHYGAGKFFMIWMSGMGFRTGTFTQCLLIWIICYTAAFLISKIPFKICRLLVQ